MDQQRRYFAEYCFLAIVIALTVGGFWNLYFGANANPDPYQHLHVATNVAWLALLSCQLVLVGRHDYATHRNVGLAILLAAPLLVATTALLSVHSAHKGLVSGQGDFMIVQNVGATLQLALLVLLAFVLRKRRKLHGYFMLSTAMLFMGIALFFTLVGIVPGFRIEGPETFHRFETAGTVGRYACLAVGVLFLARDAGNGWPMLLAASFFSLNEWIKAWLESRALVEPLTTFVGSLSQPVTFAGSFAVMLVALAATGILSGRRSGKAFKPGPLRDPA